MGAIIVLLIIVIGIVTYKNREKEKHIRELTKRIQEIEEKYKRLISEDSREKENLVLKNKIAELEKRLTELKIGENKKKLSKEKPIDKSHEYKEIGNRNNNLNSNKKNIHQKSNKTPKEQFIHRELDNTQKNLQKSINNKSLSNEEEKYTKIDNLKNKEEIINRAKFLANNNLWNDEAIKLNSIIIEIDKRNIAAYTRLAKCYVVKENYVMAENLYKKVLTFDPNNTIAKNRLHDVEIQIKRQFNYRFFKVIRYFENQFKSFVTIDSFNNEFIIFYIDTYNPYRRGNNKRFRKKEDGNILRLKENEVEVIKEYSNLFNLKLKNLKEVLNENEVVIISVPSSKAGKKNGINYVAESVAKENGFLDKSSNLIRFKDIHKLSIGGKRDKEVHLESIKYLKDQCDLSNKTIILMDDIITTGNSLIACREILIRYGAKQIIGLGIGKTYTN